MKTYPDGPNHVFLPGNFVAGQMVVMRKEPSYPGDPFYKEFMGKLHQVSFVEEIPADETHMVTEFGPDHEIIRVRANVRDSACANQLIVVDGEKYSSFYFRHATRAELRHDTEETRLNAKARL